MQFDSVNSHVYEALANRENYKLGKKFKLLYFWPFFFTFTHSTAHHQLKNVALVITFNNY